MSHFPLLKYPFVLFPVFPAKRRNRHSVSGLQVGSRGGGSERAPVRRSNTMPPNLGGAGILGRLLEERNYGNVGGLYHTHAIRYY